MATLQPVFYLRNPHSLLRSVVFLFFAAAPMVWADEPLLSTVATVLYKADQKPAESALVDVRSKEKVVEELRTDHSGVVKFSGLQAKSRYKFTARKSGFRRTYVEELAGESVKLELVKKYGPPVRESN